MTPEEYQRIKDAEKEHLRALKKLKRAVRDLERSKSIANSVTRMSTTSETALETHQEMVDKLALETAHQEARLEVAMESADQKAREAANAEELERLDAELARERARSIVEDIRSEMEAGVDSQEADARVGPAGESRAQTGADATGEDEAALPEKTIGRMRRGNTDSSE
ncbi:MAG: hypothetical protein KJO98_14970 [Rhodothermia bacterium]|nr:hypothetical protein [Rhodothermia bacterium]